MLLPFAKRFSLITSSHHHDGESDVITKRLSPLAPAAPEAIKTRQRTIPLIARPLLDTTTAQKVHDKLPRPDIIHR